MSFSIVINQSKQLRYFSELTLGYVHTTMPYWKVFTPARKPYQIGPLLTHKNGDFGAISVTELYCAALIFKVESHCLLYQIAFRDCTFSSAPQRPFCCGQHKYWTADCGLRTADCRLQTVDCGLRTADCGLRTADCGLRTTDCGPRTADHGLRTGYKIRTRYEMRTPD